MKATGTKQSPAPVLLATMVAAMEAGPLSKNPAPALPQFEAQPLDRLLPEMVSLVTVAVPML